MFPARVRPYSFEALEDLPLAAPPLAGDGPPFGGCAGQKGLSILAP